MKKLLGMVCCAFMIVTAQANCCSDTESETGCQIRFNGSASGKISCGVDTAEYKTVKNLKVKSCELVVGTNDVTVVVTGTKKGVGEFTKELTCSTFDWNVFGKDINKMTNLTKKKTLKLESEIYFVASDEDGTMEVNGVLFGTVKATVKPSTCCGDEPEVTYVPGKFTGKFVGWSEASDCACYTQLTYELGEKESTACTACGDVTTILRDCLTFTEPAEDPVEYFHGSITLKYNSKNSGYIAR